MLEFKSNLLETLSGKTTNLLRLAGNLLDECRKAFTEYGRNHRDEIINGAKEVFFELAKRTDIPLVPPAAEVLIEQHAWDVWIHPNLESMADLLFGPKETASG